MATKKKKMPKKPKQSSSLQTWQNYEARVKEVNKYNSQLEADKKKKKAIILRNR